MLKNSDRYVSPPKQVDTRPSFPQRIAYRPEDPLMFANWFDAADHKHLTAYVLYKESCGDWPAWVEAEIKDKDIVMHDHWEILINENMASAWIHSCLKEHVARLPRASVDKVIRQARDT